MVVSSSNLECFLNSTTPVVPSQFLPKSEVRKLNRLWHPWEREKVEYFTLGDLWNSFDEWSAYGAGVPITVDDAGDDDNTVIQYYVPYLSAIQIFTSNSSSFNYQREETDSETRDSCSDTFSDESESEKGAGVPGIDVLKEVSIFRSNLMAVAWYPIYHIPMGRTIKDLSTCFLTYHTLSSSFQDMDIEDDNGFSKKKRKEGEGIRLPPFGLATYKMQGDVWISSKNQKDQEKLVSLMSVADSWLRQLGRFQSNPGLHHWKAAKKVLRYLQGTKEYKLTYTRSDNLEVIGYSDSDFAKCTDTSRSTSGYMPLKIICDNSAYVSFSNSNSSTRAGLYLDAKMASGLASVPFVESMFTGTKRKSKDVGWEYGVIPDKSVPDRIKCTLYEKLVKRGGVTRLKQHIAQITGQTTSCPKATKEDQLKCQNAINEGKLKKQGKRQHDEAIRSEVRLDSNESLEDDEVHDHSMKEPNVFGLMDNFANTVNPEQSLKKKGNDKNVELSNSIRKERIWMTKKYVARWAYESAIPFHAFENDSFKMLLEVVGQFGPGLPPPTRYELSTPLLKEEVERTKNLVKRNKKE
ncbi:hypothetical protein Tco_0537091 [Tanacetum coccineum]